jgi:hypothetical protein
LRASLIFLVLGWSAVALADPVSSVPDDMPIEAMTADGDRVKLFSNGRWVFVDAAKARSAEKQAAAYPENKTRPIEAQGGLFGGVGRLVMPGDKDYNRGSLNPKLH